MRYEASSDRTVPAPTQIATLWLAGAFITLAGFGLVRYIHSLAPWIPGPESVVYGVFHTSLPHTLVHLGLGAGALFAAGSARSCLIFLAAAGATLLLLVSYGQVDKSPVLPAVVPLRDADVLLHVVLACAMVVACLAALKPRRRRVAHR